MQTAALHTGIQKWTLSKAQSARCVSTNRGPTPVNQIEDGVLTPAMDLLPLYCSWYLRCNLYYLVVHRGKVSTEIPDDLPKASSTRKWPFRPKSHGYKAHN